jgi:hypothetical protein
MQHLTRSKTGVHGYRRGVPDRLRPAIGKTEIIRSLRVADPKAVASRYAKVHAEVERLFAEADGRVPCVCRFDMAVASLRCRHGIDPADAARMPHHDHPDAQDAVLSAAGYSARRPERRLDCPQAPIRAKATAAALSIVAWWLGIVAGRLRCEASAKAARGRGTWLLGPRNRHAATAFSARFDGGGGVGLGLAGERAVRQDLVEAG